MLQMNILFAALKTVSKDEVPGYDDETYSENEK